ncbi:hypothetical protein J3F83DRAFT_67021 [Trichoderma novae-zelandiae]
MDMPQAREPQAGDEERETRNESVARVCAEGAIKTCLEAMRWLPTGLVCDALVSCCLQGDGPSGQAASSIWVHRRKPPCEQSAPEGLGNRGNPGETRWGATAKGEATMLFFRRSNRIARAVELMQLGPHHDDSMPSIVPFVQPLLRKVALADPDFCVAIPPQPRFLCSGFLDTELMAPRLAVRTRLLLRGVSSRLLVRWCARRKLIWMASLRIHQLQLNVVLLFVSRSQRLERV